MQDCPFCGGPVKIICGDEEPCFAKCKQCGYASGAYGTEKQAINAHNQLVTLQKGKVVVPREAIKDEISDKLGVELSDYEVDDLYFAMLSARPKRRGE